MRIFFGVGDDEVEAAAQGDGNAFVAVARESEFEAGGKGLVQPGREQAVKRNVGQLAQGTQDGFAGREHQRVFNKWAVGIFQCQGKFGGDDRAHQNGFSRAHGQRQDVAGVVESEGFAQGFQPVLAYKSVVGFDPLNDLFQAGVGNQLGQLLGVQSHGGAARAFDWEQRFVQRGDARRVQHQP